MLSPILDHALPYIEHEGWDFDEVQDVAEVEGSGFERDESATNIGYDAHDDTACSRLYERLLEYEKATKP